MRGREATAATMAARRARQTGRRPALPAARLQMRFARHLAGARWRCSSSAAIVVPRSLVPSNILAVIPLAAFLAIAAMGETLVLMTRGIDLSIPAVITLSSTLLLGVSGGSDCGLAGGDRRGACSPRPRSA